MTTQVAIVGASGRMGQLFTRLIERSTDFELHAAVGSGDQLTEVLGADIVVDVTIPAVSQSVVEFAVAHGINVLVGTSGWSTERIANLETRINGNLAVGVIIVPNFSLGSVLATSFAATAARYFESVEIVEAHHATKIDSPSGTAVRTAELIGAARAAIGPLASPHVDQRARGQQVSGVPIHSLRLRGVVAQQDVIFGGSGELLTIRHETLSPTAYEAGILLSLAAARTARGVIVGLDRVIGLGDASASTP